jgi:phage-related minor tail protein/phage-related protein
MADRIKGITIEIGGDTTALSKALSGVNKEINSTQKQLRDVERLLKLDPGNVTLLEQKQRLLADSVEQTRQKLDSLKSAEKQVQQQFAQGKVSQAQYDALQREIVATEADLRKAEKAASNFQDEIAQSKGESALKQLGDAASETASEVKKIDEKPIEDVEDAAKDADDALEEAGDSASSFADHLKADILVEGIKQIVSGIKDLNEETKEYRKIMGTLETSSEAAGYSAEETSEAFSQLYGALGDDQSAATTTANLQAIGASQKDINSLISSAVGAWAKYGDSIPIDGLAESINETIRAGQVTGTFADVLNWGSKEGETFGVMLKENTEENEEWNKAVQEASSAEDFFNLALQDAETQADRTNLVLQAMADQGLSDVGDAWYSNNKDIVDANNAQLEFTKKASELSERVQPVLTAVQEGINGILQAILDATAGIDMDTIVGYVQNFFDAVSNVVSFLIENKEIVIGVIGAIGLALTALKIVEFVQSVISGISAISGALSFLAANPVVLAIAGIAALIAVLVLIVTKGEEIKAWLAGFNEWLQGVFATDWTEIFGPVLGNVLNGFFALLKGIWDGVYQVLNGVIDFIQGIFTGNWEQAWSGVQQIVSGVWDTITGIITGACDLIKGILLGLDSWLQGVFKTDWTEIFGPGLGDIINAFMKNVENTWNAIKQIFQGVLDFIKGVFTGNWKQAWQGVVNIFGGLFNSLINMVKAPLNGIIGLLNGAVGAINSLIGGLNSISFTMPKWLGGGHFGLSIPYIPNIPYLAKGGILSQGSAIVGEAGPELLTMMGNRAMVQPLTSNTTNQTDLGGVNITVYGAPGQDVRALADIIMDEMQNATERKAAVFGA